MRRRVLQCFRVALTTRLESDAELLLAEDTEVPLRRRRFLEFYNHHETRIRAAAQVVLADVVDSHRATAGIGLSCYLGCATGGGYDCLPRMLTHTMRASWTRKLSWNCRVLCGDRYALNASWFVWRKHFGSQLVEFERNMVRARHGEEQSAGLWRIEMANVHAHAAAEQEAEVVRCRFLAAAALDNASAHAENRYERLVVRERDRAAVAELVFADRGVQLRGKVLRKLIAIEVLNDCWTRCGFLRVSMKSLLWLWLLREIVIENTVEERETVFCATSIKFAMVPYLNGSCMSLLGMSSGPHGQTFPPAHEFGSVNVSDEVCYKSCSLHKSAYIVFQRDHCVCFDSHSGIPANPSSV